MARAAPQLGRGRARQKPPVRSRENEFTDGRVEFCEKCFENSAVRRQNVYPVEVAVKFRLLI